MPVKFGNIRGAVAGLISTSTPGLPPSGDATGQTDLLNISNTIAGAANLGFTSVEVMLQPGVFYVNQPIVLQAQGVGLAGTLGATDSGDDTGNDLGTTIKTAPMFTNPAFHAFATGVVLVIDQQPGARGAPTFGVRIRDLQIDASSAPANVDGISFFGTLQSVGVYNVGVFEATGTGFNFVEDPLSSARSPFTDGAVLINCILQKCAGYGVAGKANDTLAVGVHAQGCGLDGWLITGGNAFLDACRADHCANGFTCDVNPGGGGVDGALTLVNCGTEGNNQFGLNIINSSNAGTGHRAAVIVAGCKFAGDGVNGGLGGGGFAGVSVAGANRLIWSSSVVITRTDDVPAPPTGLGCPEYGLVTAASGTGPGIPVSIVCSSGFLGGMTAPVLDAAGVGANLIISSQVTFGIGFMPAVVSPWPEAITGGSLALAGAYTSQGAAVQVTNTSSTGASPLAWTAAAAGDGVFAAQVTGDTSRRAQFDVNGTWQWGPGTAAPDCTLRRLTTARIGFQSCDVAVHTAGHGLQVAEGTNAKQGTAILAAGLAGVTTTAVTANSRIFLTIQDPNGGTPGALYVAATTPGTGFAVESTSGADTSIFAWEIFEPG